MKEKKKTSKLLTFSLLFHIFAVNAYKGIEIACHHQKYFLLYMLFLLLQQQTSPFCNVSSSVICSCHHYPGHQLQMSAIVCSVDRTLKPIDFNCIQTGAHI